MVSVSQHRVYADICDNYLPAQGGSPRVRRLRRVKGHRYICLHGTGRGFTRVGVDAAGQIHRQHKGAGLALRLHHRTGGSPGGAQAAVKTRAVQRIDHNVRLLHGGSVGHKLHRQRGQQRPESAVRQQR